MNKMYRYILVGNPNVGKSSLFNALCHMHQHTGNWIGKTIESQQGYYEYQNDKYQIIDLPGMYSFLPQSKEEKITNDYLKKQDFDGCIVVCDASNLYRSIFLLLQIKQVIPNVIAVFNLIDEAKRKGIEIDINGLKRAIDVDIVVSNASKNQGIEELKTTIKNKRNKCCKQSKVKTIDELQQMTRILMNKYVSHGSSINQLQHKLDVLFTHHFWGSLCFLLLLIFVFYLTLSLANIPSSYLASLFAYLQDSAHYLFQALHVHPFLEGLLIDGMLNCMGWVVSVMFTPMAIFFPLFAILEDIGYLPRLAYLFDPLFQKIKSNGRCAYIMMMGFGCNAVGVSQARVLSNKKQRIMAMLTNTFIPCNGRFPIILTLISIFFTTNAFLSAIYMLLFILLGIMMSFIVSYFVAKMPIEEDEALFLLELPPFRRVNIGMCIYRCFRDKMLKVLYRAIVASLVAGMLIWLLTNISINNQVIVSYLINILQPLGNLMGLDGVILLAFILGLPANEIVLPLILMMYLGSGQMVDIESSQSILAILQSHDWNTITALCTIVFVIIHYPCATTLMTIKKESNSILVTITALFLPLLCGIIMAMLINMISIII